MPKGLGPKDSLSKLPKLTPELHKFIDGMGMYFESQGIPRIGGRMLGALMIAHWPLSAEDLASILRVSRGSISTNMRMLLASGLVEKAPMPGSRTTHFAFSDEAMEHRIAAGVRSTQAFKRLLLQAADVIPQRDPARHHIDDSLAWSDVLLEALRHAVDHWKAHRTGAAHRHPALSGD
jgi:DNA-binding transcriptional regulator GbsR (MarR family)